MHGGSAEHTSIFSFLETIKIIVLVWLVARLHKYMYFDFVRGCVRGCMHACMRVCMRVHACVCRGGRLYARQEIHNFKVGLAQYSKCYCLFLTRYTHAQESLAQQ